MKLSESLRAAAIANPAYIQQEDGKRDQMVVMSVDLIDEIAQLEKDSEMLNALKAAGVDNWDGYSFARREMDKQECQGCEEEFDEDDIRRTDDDVPLCVPCFDECASEQDPDAIT